MLKQKYTEQGDRELTYTYKGDMDMTEGENRGLSKSVHVSFVVITVFFSIDLMVLDLTIKWEFWMVPVFIVMGAGTLLIYIFKIFTQRQSIYIYATILIFEVFYFSVHIDLVYEITGLILLVMALTAASREKVLFILSIAVGLFAMVLHYVTGVSSEELMMDIPHILRGGLQFVIVIMAAIVAGYIVARNQDMREGYKEILEKMKTDNYNSAEFYEDATRLLMEKMDKGEDVERDFGRISEYLKVLKDDITINNEPYRVSELIENLPVSNENIEIKLTIEKGTPEILVGDKEKLRGIILNFIDNSMAHTSKGGIYIHIFTRESKRGINLCINAEDTGEGINPEKVDTIFNATGWNEILAETKNLAGVGILVINEYLRQMGGFMRAQSDTNAGVRIRLTVPQGQR